MTTAEELKEIEKWTKKKKEAEAKIEELLMPEGLRGAHETTTLKRDSN